jgi:predicted nucleic acid-binding Zn ribbon protein
MPHYEYECEHGDIRTIVASMHDDRPQEFEASCNEEDRCVFHRVFSTFNGRFGDTPVHHR